MGSSLIFASVGAFEPVVPATVGAADDLEFSAAVPCDPRGESGELRYFSYQKHAPLEGWSVGFEGKIQGMYLFPPHRAGKFPGTESTGSSDEQHPGLGQLALKARLPSF